jgi:hypothetical protein
MKVVCQHFNVHFSVAHGGRSDISQHLRSQKHKDAEKTEICCIRLLHLRNIHGMIVVKYSPPS